MSRFPVPLSTADLSGLAATSAEQFRQQRLNAKDAWAEHFQQARGKFEHLFRELNDLNPDAISDGKLADVYRLGLGEAIRYLAGPPISDDDLRVIADVDSLSPGALARDHQALRKVFGVIEKVMDPYRFPWVLSGKPPSAKQREAALMASSVLLAAQRVATARRNDGKERQETQVKEYLLHIGFEEVGTQSIHTIVQGPQSMQFCAECKLGERKADIVVRLHDTRLLAIECKVSNSATNSVKRLNNDAAVKAQYWTKLFGTSQVVPVAVLAGVFNVLNLEQAQDRGLALFWSHDLDRLGAFIRSTGAGQR